MWADLLSLVVTGAFAACLVFIAGRLMKRRGKTLPRFIMPAAIGLSMLVFSVWNEYTWYGRMTTNLPQTVMVVGSGSRSVPWAPWTYVKPVKVRFVALDQADMLHSEARPGLVQTRLYLVERWQPTRVVNVAFDCTTHRRADLPANARLTPEGTLEGAQWQSVDPDDSMMQAACRSQ